MRDWWTAAAPLACGIHCLLTPVAGLMLPAMQLVPGLELWMFGSALSLGSVTILRAIRVGAVMPPVLFACAMLVVGLLLLTGEVFGEFVTGAAYLAVALTLLLNARAVHAAECRAREHCAAVAEPAR